MSRWMAVISRRDSLDAPAAVAAQVTAVRVAAKTTRLTNRRPRIESGYCNHWARKRLPLCGSSQRAHGLPSRQELVALRTQIER
jgi:hypothetical protein